MEQRERRTRFEGYLLGTLTEEERAGVREEAIRNPDAEAELREIELDLLDAAARGTLDPDRQRRVETYLAVATHNRDGWQLARALAEREAHATPAIGEVSRVSSRWFAGWPAAAAVLIAAAGLALYLRGTSPSGPGGAVRGSRPDADHVPSGSAPAPSPSGSSPSASASAGTSSAPGSSAAAGASPSSAPSAAASDTAPSKLPKPLPKLGAGDIALYLPASVLRGSRPTARITSATETVRLDIEIEAPVPSLVNIAVLQVPTTGEAVWSQVGVPTVRVRGGEHIASVHVPVRVLPTGAIEIVVTTPDKAWTPRVFPVLLRRD